MTDGELMDLAARTVERARALGANEVSASVSSGRHVTLSRRERRIEQATEATTRGLVLSVLVDDRFTSNSTSDLRPDALEAFVRRCVESARFLEPDPFRRQPERARCGRGVSEETLDQNDPAWGRRTASDRAAQCEHLEELLWASRDAAGAPIVSCSATVADGWAEGVRVLSNGFADRSCGAWFSVSTDMTLEEGEKRPEGFAHYGARHLADLPTDERVTDECVRNTRQRLGAGPIASGAYPMLLENRAAGRILSMLSGPLAGSSLHEGRSCLRGKIGATIGAEGLTIVDDPTIPRGLGSRPWDGDALVARPIPIVERGVLRNYYVSQYYGRKLGMEPTTGGRSNWVVSPGTRSFAAIARDLPRAVQVTGFLGGNSNSTTGDFSFGIRGLLLEHGEIVASLSEMNVSGNLLKLLGQLQEVGDDPWTYAALRSPSLLFADVRFSGS